SWEAALGPWRKPYGKHATVPLQLARQFSTLPDFRTVPRFPWWSRPDEGCLAEMGEKRTMP
ncbi:MAG: hypothetical protein HW380_1780, partial [Magnetococcales bacterium]|nr:hypothetical protein [Magnetococcales bacterium]